MKRMRISMSHAPSDAVQKPLCCSEELENEHNGTPQPLEEARQLAEAILRLDGLTGAEIEAAESALTDEPVNIGRLRQIAANHSILTPQSYEQFAKHTCLSRRW
jgi:hypothetical protein